MFVEGFDAVGADLGALAINASPLEIYKAAGFNRRIIMTAKESSGRGHYRFFAASRTSSHKPWNYRSKLVFLQLHVYFDSLRVGRLYLLRCHP